MFTKRVNVFVLYHVFGKTFCLISFTCREVENTRRVMIEKLLLEQGAGYSLSSLHFT